MKTLMDWLATAVIVGIGFTLVVLVLNIAFTSTWSGWQ